MDILLDTHAMVWFFRGDKSLSKTAELVINDPANNIYVSLVSLWEIVIKASVNKPIIQKTVEEIIILLDRSNMRLLNIGATHLSELSKLSMYHGDPFDRLLIAQAISERLTIVSADRHFADYPVPVIW